MVRRGSVEIVVFVVLGAFCSDLDGQPLVGKLIHPDAVRDRSGARHCAAFIPCLRGGGGLAPEFPARVNESVERFLVVEDEDDAKLLYAHAETGLKLNHLHERVLWWRC